MISKTKTLILHYMISLALLTGNATVLSITGDTEQPILIESNTQSLDMCGNTIIFSGHVIMTQGTIQIHADKVIVTRRDSKQGKEIIDGYGNPATFYQMQDNGKPVRGHAFHMHHELAENLLILSGNAYLEQLDSNITADQITYLIKGKKMKAYGTKGKRVTATLFPSQLQGKR